jgi:TRAP-type C4-dicarboxylate transport system substrate-binding protein
MLKNNLRSILFALLLLPGTAMADPIKLKLSFFTSDRSNIYLAQIKPFVDAVNAEGKGLVEIDVYFSGAISKVQAAQPELVKDGTADLALVVPGQTPEIFADIGVTELPGLFRNAHEASRIFGRLVAADALAGFNDFVMIGPLVTEGQNINSRKPIDSLADLSGQTIRTNNPMEAATLEKLGAVPVLLAINQTMDKLSQGKIDGATVPPSLLFEFGFGRLTSHHYTIQLGGVPTALLMNRAKFESLPPQAQKIISKYSGDWLSDRSAAAFDEMDAHALTALKADTQRVVTSPTPADGATIRQAYAAVIKQWASANRHNRELLDKVNAEIAKARAGN